MRLEHDGEGDDHHDAGGDHHEDQRRTSARTEWIQRRDAKLTQIQDHFYRLKSKMASSSALCKDSKDKEDFFERAAKVDGHILAAFQEFSDVPDLPQRMVANGYRGDRKRGQRAQTPQKNAQQQVVVALTALLQGFLQPLPRTPLRLLNLPSFISATRTHSKNMIDRIAPMVHHLAMINYSPINTFLSAKCAQLSLLL